MRSKPKFLNLFHYIDRSHLPSNIKQTKKLPIETFTNTETEPYFNYQSNSNVSE